MSVDRWFVVTNTDNLKYYFDCNMVVDKQAFLTNSYYQDIQESRPCGYIVLSRAGHLSEALKAAASGGENLSQCLLEIDIDAIKVEKLYARNRSGSYDQIEADLGHKKEITEVLLPAPLPMGVIIRLVLESADASRTLQDELSSQFGSFSPKYFSHDAKLFGAAESQDINVSKTPDMFSESKNDEVVARDIDYQKGFSYGGALALAYYQTKNGLLSGKLYRKLSNVDNFEREPSILNAMRNWLVSSQLESDLDKLVKIVLDISAPESAFGTFQYDLLHCFESKADIPETYSHLSGFSKMLQEILDKTRSESIEIYFEKLIEYYKKHDKSGYQLYLLISLLFYRDSIDTALRFYHKDFTEEDYFLVAVFYGLIRGISRVPKVIRTIEGARNWISAKMVELVHMNEDSKLKLQKEPTSLALFHEKYLKDTTNPKEQDNLQAFAKVVNIEESSFIDWVLQTKGEYVVNGSRVKFSERPKLKAQIRKDALEKELLKRTIATDDLFDFNKVFDCFRT